MDFAGSVGVDTRVLHVLDADRAFVPGSASVRERSGTSKVVYELEDDASDETSSSKCDVFVRLVVDEVVRDVRPHAGLRVDPPRHPSQRSSHAI